MTDTEQEQEPKPPPSRLDEVLKNVESLPEWARPPFYGAFFVYALMAGRAILLLPLLAIGVLVKGPEFVLQALWVAIVGGLAGLAGGTAWSLARTAPRRVGRPGTYVKWWLAVAVYMATAFALLSRDEVDPRHHFALRDPVEWVIVVALSVLFGSILAGFELEARPKRRPPWAQRKQRVTSRVHPPAS
ncbi:hypothetical protein J421_5339 (plasmid) [Gemmatirosa kalamazoonensis]|uniref:Uncharacterized protein n=1 Tax=Gemmatirosa kalamazoonensis TaxID=861299 RepID=W0RPD9_9BACT|nr:hypothetical protein [Gemmatirosa kalamazoonensis]AHG92874.1 hypothetical protein J421_5339 [Gemmatirosa kalamazoonensis]